MPETKIVCGDALNTLRQMHDNSVHCVVTSPPYFGLRDYGVAGQVGLEPTPAEFVAKLVEIFREVRRVLRPDGTCWLNLGDTYASAWVCNRRSTIGAGSLPDGKRANRPNRLVEGLKEKDLIGIPWRVAFALQADGWYLRQDIIWHKPNPMPESVRDRCTKAHEYLFLLTKSEKYYFDADAIAEASVQPDRKRNDRVGGASHVERQQHSEGGRVTGGTTKNRRSVWTIAPKPYKVAHFATFPPALVEPCIKAGSPEGGIVMDIFGGAGTTGLVAKNLNRHCILIELNPEYVKLIEKRLAPT